ncbi:MAG: hypothetical protein AVDCRST_MAG57-2649, partial [uncultured Blastococcus sp.]
DQHDVDQGPRRSPRSGRHRRAPGLRPGPVQWLRRVPRCARERAHRGGPGDRSALRRHLRPSAPGHPARHRRHRRDQELREHDLREQRHHPREPLPGETAEL